MTSISALVDLLAHLLFYWLNLDMTPINAGFLRKSDKNIPARINRKP